MTRSLPEKTFEHWCSIHLTYRYRAKLRQWWPSSGADIEIEMDPTRTDAFLGKRFWLELKVPEWDPASGTHVLKVDLKQLIAYDSQCVPVYYVFPVPAWVGVLGKRASSAWLRPSGGSSSLTPLHWADLAFESYAQEEWFARWTWVVPAKRLSTALASEIATFQSGQRKTKTATIGSITPGNTPAHSRHKGKLHPSKNLAGPLTPILWHEFLKRMEQCGSPDYPAQFILPANINLAASMNTTRQCSREDLRKALSELNGSPFVSEAVVYSPLEGDSYAPTVPERVLSHEGFIWDETTSRGLISLPPKALILQVSKS